MIKLIKSTFYNESLTKKKLIQFIKSADQLSFGKECELFEHEFAKYQGRKYCVFVNSGSSANLALIQSLVNLKKIEKNDLVGFSGLTWSTNVMPLIQLGLEPVPIDVELNTLNVSSRMLGKIVRRFPIKAFFLTNLLGFCDDIDVIKKICSENNIILIEDNCEALGSVYKKTKLGNFGLASTFSFYVGHHMSTIEGGAICTDSLALASMLKLVRAHGWDRNLSLARQTRIRKKHNINSNFYSRYTFYDLGYNLRPTELQGFLGTIQIKYLDKIIKLRNKNFLDIAPVIYSQTKKFYELKYKHIDLHSNFAIPVICKSKEIRKELVMKCKNILEIRPIVGGDMTKQPFFSKYSKVFKKYHYNSNAKLIHDQGLYFGNNPELTGKEKKIIINLFTK